MRTGKTQEAQQGELPPHHRFVRLVVILLSRCLRPRPRASGALLGFESVPQNRRLGRGSHGVEETRECLRSLADAELGKTGVFPLRKDESGRKRCRAPRSVRALPAKATRGQRDNASGVAKLLVKIGSKDRA